MTEILSTIQISNASCNKFTSMFQNHAMLSESSESSHTCFQQYRNNINISNKINDSESLLIYMKII